MSSLGAHVRKVQFSHSAVHGFQKNVYKSLRKHTYSNILKITPPENYKFSDKNSDIFHISVQNIDCGHSSEPPRRGSGEYPQSMFLSRNKKIMYTPVNHSFTV